MAADEKNSDAGLVQVLLQAHFETMAAIQSILSMSEGEAIQAAKTILSKMMSSCSSVTSHVIKPDGSLMPTEAFAPTRSGTPKRKKQAALTDPSPMKPMAQPSFASAEHLSGSPGVRMSPKRRKAAASKKGVSFTPKKKSPIKGLKRGVRWRDDTEEGTLAEFEKTPQKVEQTDSVPSSDNTIPLSLRPDQPLPEPSLSANDSLDSSPIPAPPTVSLEAKPKNNRFKAGFLAKKTDGSPLPPTLTQFSSDSDHSPLRELEPSKAGNRSSLHHVENVSNDVTPCDSGNNSGSEREDTWTASKNDAMKINKAVKRASMAAPSSTQPLQRQRRRSPTPSSSASPPNENLFTASHARRMVKSEKENDWKASILSPRTAPVVKHPAQRRTTMGSDRPQSRDSSITGREAVRLSSAAITGSGGGPRGSLLVGGKGAWR